MINEKYKQFKVYYHDEFEDKTVTTDWDVFKTKKKAIERLKELKEEFGNDGDEYSVTEIFIISEKQFLREIKKARQNEAMTTKEMMYANFLNEMDKYEEGAGNQGNVTWQTMWRDLKFYLLLKLKGMKRE